MGTGLSVVLPSPSWPDPLAPQHLTPPESVSTHVSLPPEAMATTPLARPVTSTGVRLSMVVAPVPSAPLAFEPQHWTPPAAVIAHVCASPAATEVTPLASPVTATGVRLPVLVPFPSSPLPLYLPQQSTAPAAVIAHA